MKYLFNWLRNLGRDSSPRINEIEFQPSWDIRCEIMDLLEKEGYDLKIRSGKRDMSIVDFNSLKKLNEFLEEYNLTAEEIKTHKILNPHTGELFVYIKILSNNKKDFKKNLKKASLSLFKKGQIAVFYVL